MTTVAISTSISRAGTGQRQGTSTVSWILFLLLNATLFMRPAEVVPQLEGLPIYEVLILLCLITTLRELLQKLQWSSLRRNPITICVLLMFPAIVLSRLVQGDTWYARELGIDFAKVICYYLLLVASLDSPRRFSAFLVALAMYALVLTGVALLSYHHIIDLATVAPLKEGLWQPIPGTKRHAIVMRLQAAGIYGNPNDLARIIDVGITICLFALLRKGSLLLRSWWLAPLTVFSYALHLTYSRGGLLALAAGIVVLLHARFGAKKGGVILLLLLPAVVLFAGRQTDIDTSSGTAQLRIKLWSAGLVALRSSPVFGIGAGTYFHMAGNHAHNSFVEAFVETGLVGGIAFAGAFYLATSGLYRLKSEEMRRLDPETWRLRPYILSLVVGTIASQFSSSREYSLPTYMILGLAAAYLSVVGDRTPASLEVFSRRLVFRVIVVGIGTLIFLHLYTKFNANFG